MAIEYERALKKLIIPERNALVDATIETSECLKAWWDQTLIKRNWEGGHSDVGGFNCT
jgi:hypothetical protein